MIHFDFNNMMAETIGSEHGIQEQELKDAAPHSKRCRKNTAFSA